MMYFFIPVATLFIITVLLQQKESSLGSMGGSDSGEAIVQGRRGADKFLHRVSILLATLLLAGGIYAMMTASTPLTV